MSKSKKMVMKYKLAITISENENNYELPKHNVKQNKQKQNNATI